MDMHFSQLAKSMKKLRLQLPIFANLFQVAVNIGVEYGEVKN